MELEGKLNERVVLTTKSEVCWAGLVTDVLTVRDNGAGYPEAVLRNLSGTDDPNAPHILGLHLVQQIATAHEGEASFCNDGGAVAALKFAVQESTK